MINCDLLEYKIFVEKYYRVSLSFLLEVPFNIQLLLKIHEYLFGDKYIKYDASDEEYVKINDLMNKLFENMKKGLPTHKLIECIENMLGLIYLYQPFYDGNRRSCLILQKILYHLLGIQLYIPLDEKIINYSLVELFYYETDTIQPEAINKKLKRSRLYLLEGKRDENI